MDAKESMEVELSQTSLADYLKRQYPGRHIIFDVRPQMLDELLVELRIRGYKTINDINKTLTRTAKAVALFEKDYPPSNLEDSHYSGIGIVRLSMLLLDDDFFTFQKSVLDDSGIRENLAKYRQHILPEDSVD
jgi:hypothetical protein